MAVLSKSKTSKTKASRTNRTKASLSKERSQISVNDKVLLNKSLKKIILLLKDGNFHSGEQLGKTLQLTRSAIWKSINQLKTLGIEIESCTNRGYKIPGGLDLLNKEDILNRLDCFNKTADFNKKETNTSTFPLIHIDIFDSLPSTNDYLLELCSASTSPKKTVACFAERQTKGKGRLGRIWISPFAKNLYFSLLWHFPNDPSELSGLSLAAAIAVVQTLKQFGITDDLSLKWPNDVLWKNQKIAGILIELTCEAHNICSTVIGIGLNIDMPTQFQNKITQPWTDIKSILKSEALVSRKLSKDSSEDHNQILNNLNRSKLAGTLLNELIKTIVLFQNEGFQAFIPLWKSLDATSNREINVQTVQGQIKGIGRGINAQGHFLLEHANGEIKHYSSGEISILKETITMSQ